MNRWQTIRRHEVAFRADCARYRIRNRAGRYLRRTPHHTFWLGGNLL